MEVQFTEDARALRDTSCHRCQILVKVGQPLHTVQNSKGEGKNICQKCFDHYKSKPSTVVRSTSTGLYSAPRESQHQLSLRQSNVDLVSIRSQVNNGQRTGARVTSMPPPALPRSQIPPMARPNIVNPTHNHGSSRLSAIGYSSAHADHVNERDRWAGYANVKQGKEVIYRIPIKAIAVFIIEPEGSKKLKQPYGVINTLSEGGYISSNATAAQIISQVVQLLDPGLQKYAPGFPFDTGAMDVRELSLWINLRGVIPHEPYFDSQRFFALTKGKNPTLKFKAPEPIEFGLVFDPDEWERLSNYKENRNVKPSTVQRSQQATTISEFPDNEPLRAYDTFTSRTTFQESHNSTDKERRNSHLQQKRPWSEPSTASDNENMPEVSEAFGRKPVRSIKFSSLPLLRVIKLHPSTKKSKTGNHISIASNRSQASTRDTAPPSGPANTDKIREGLIAGGKISGIDFRALVSVTTLTIQYKALRTATFEELVNKKPPPAPVMQESPIAGQLSFDPKAKAIGIGTFKAAHLASLILFTLNDTGIGQRRQSVNEAILVVKKRVCQPRTRPGGKRLAYGALDELFYLYIECNMLCWAKALLELANTFIASKLTTHLPDKPDFYVPNLRFVDGGIATVVGASGESGCSFLIEERLDHTLFQKYVHNGEAVPLTEPHEEGYEIAVYACFIQHVQYVLTGEMAFISDFQGTGEVLTDPQIMTDPALGDDLFGEGNLGKIFNQFPLQHSCNKYCQWFKLDPLLPEDGTCAAAAADSDSESFHHRGTAAGTVAGTGRRDDPINLAQE
ncbi:hypothetical protein H0H93_012195 [Arthromyces matolae]|nr:hypothetical protein H0H93_012195 [Arthromyces matolae]